MNLAPHGLESPPYFAEDWAQCFCDASIPIATQTGARKLWQQSVDWLRLTLDAVDRVDAHDWTTTDFNIWPEQLHTIVEAHSPGHVR